MGKKAGVWIDLKKALIVTLDNDQSELKTIDSQIEKRERYEGEGKIFGRFGDQFLNTERKKEKRYQKEIKTYLKQILDKLGRFDSLVIFGPAQMKLELNKYIKEHSHGKGEIAEVVSADSMTENQVVAWVRDYYQKVV